MEIIFHFMEDALKQERIYIDHSTNIWFWNRPKGEKVEREDDESSTYIEITFVNTMDIDAELLLGIQTTCNILRMEVIQYPISSVN
jgi:hypothetical protein